MTTRDELSNLIDSLTYRQSEVIKTLQDKAGQFVANEHYSNNLLKALEGLKVLTDIKKDFPPTT